MSLPTNVTSVNNSRVNPVLISTTVLLPLHPPKTADLTSNSLFGKFENWFGVLAFDKMAKVQLCNITVMDNPSPFSNPFQFEITFECIEELKEDLEWKMIYVGSAESEEHDQILDSVYVGPIPEGKHMFVFQADPPNVARIPENDAIGVTVVLLTCSYRGQEFIRVGYFINNEYTDLELKENPPSPPQFDKVVRNILASEPRVTRFKINWEEPSVQENGAQPPAPSGANSGEAEAPVDMPAFNENSNSWAAMECS